MTSTTDFTDWNKVMEEMHQVVEKEAGTAEDFDKVHEILAKRFGTFLRPPNTMSLLALLVWREKLIYERIGKLMGGTG